MLRYSFSDYRITYNGVAITGFVDCEDAVVISGIGSIRGGVIKLKLIGGSDGAQQMLKMLHTRPNGVFSMINEHTKERYELIGHALAVDDIVRGTSFPTEVWRIFGELN